LGGIILCQNDTGQFSGRRQVNEKKSAEHSFDFTSQCSLLIA